MTKDEKKFELYSIVLRFLSFKITNNLKKIYFDYDEINNNVILTAFYEKEPSGIELELLDDIVTDSKAHMPDDVVDGVYKLMREHDENEYKKHDFIVFSVYDGEE